MATPTATVLATIVPTLTQTVEPGFLQVMRSGKWIADTLTHILGTILGLGLGYLLGTLNEGQKKKKEDEKAEQDRLKHLTFFYEETAELRGACYLRITASRQNLDTPQAKQIVQFLSPLDIHAIYWQYREYFDNKLSAQAIYLKNAAKAFNYKAINFNKKWFTPDTIPPNTEGQRLTEQIAMQEDLNKIDAALVAINDAHPLKIPPPLSPDILAETVRTF